MPSLSFQACCHAADVLAVLVALARTGPLALQVPARKIFSIPAGARLARLSVLLTDQVHTRTCEEMGGFLPENSIKQVHSHEMV